MEEQVGGGEQQASTIYTPPFFPPHQSPHEPSVPTLATSNTTRFTEPETSLIPKDYLKDVNGKVGSYRNDSPQLNSKGSCSVEPL